MQKSYLLARLQRSLLLTVLVFAIKINGNQVLSATVAAARALPTGTAVTIDNLVLTVLYDQVNSTASKRIFGQDATGGIAIFDINAPIDLLLAGPDTLSGTMDDLVPGSRINLSGKTDSFSGLFAISTPLRWTYNGSVPVPAPIPMHLSEWYDAPVASAEAREGMLVRLLNATFQSPGGTFAGVSNYNIFEGPHTGRVRVSNANNPPPIVGTKIPSGQFDIVGILSQFDTSPLANRGYELLINEPDDLIPVPEPSTILLVLFGLAVVSSSHRRGIRHIAVIVVVITAPTTSPALTIDTVLVGNAGNPADTRYIDVAVGLGSVDYNFRMSTHEVTNAQYVEFLNAVAATDTYGLYSTSMGSRNRGGIVRAGTSGNFTFAVKPPALNGTYIYDDKPVVFVNWFCAIRFSNWLHNGQGGPETTEYGAYTLLGGTPMPSNANSITRNAGANWWLPSENEWHKAAYHKNDGVTGNYWDYPTHSNSFPNNNLPANDTGNSANFWRGHYTTGNEGFPMTDVGAYMLSGSAYNTFDQGGNVWEWTETLLSSSSRGVRGGSFGDDNGSFAAWNRFVFDPTRLGDQYGFRVATIPNLAGDFNHDGSVDAADYVLWRKNPAGFPADAYTTWRSHFGQTAGSGSGQHTLSAVPEPANLALLMFAILGLSVTRIKKPRCYRG